MTRLFRTAFCVLSLACALGATAYASDIPPVAEPVLFTSLGQSPDAKTLSVLAARAKLAGEFKPLATATDVAVAKTVFVTVGTSLKGFGSAGVNLDTEKARCTTIAKAAKDNGVYLVLVHIGGEGRRDSMTDMLLEEFAPSADAFIVYQAGNADGFFDRAAGGKPLVSVPKAVEVAKVLSGLVPGR